MNKKRILALNILSEPQFKTSFDNRIAQVFQGIDAPYDTIYLDDLSKFDDFEPYTHLLISGSTQSATAEDGWYRDLDAIIHRFISDEKSILGICFGHQFLARHILGKEHVRKSQTPEIGWTEVTLFGNPIFNEMSTMKSAVFHYDEVCDLDGRFEITASSARCAVHGFQVRGKPIWGVQFHPDFMYKDMFSFVEAQREKDARFDEIHCQAEVSPEEFRESDRVFKNWIDMS